MKANLITILLILIQVPFSFRAIGQEKKGQIFLKSPILQYAGEISGQRTAARCNIEQEEFVGGYCKIKSCSNSKNHLPGHCYCPSAGGPKLADGKCYVLLNPCESILLYRRVVNPSKWTSVEYYFSKGPEGEIIPLTKENLKNAYPDNTVFHRKLDALFRNNSQLAWFDKLNNMYFVNWVYTHVFSEELRGGSEFSSPL